LGFLTVPGFSRCWRSQFLAEVAGEALSAR